MPAEKWRVTRAQKRLEGECFRCTCSALPGNTLCVRHLDAANAAAKRYYAERAERISRTWRTEKRDVRRNAALVRQYGMTLGEFEAMVEAQGGVCAICKRAETRTDPHGVPHALAVDHDHATGAIRGGLCHRCNRVLGLMRDDPSTFRAAAAYLEEAARGDGCH